MKPAKKEAIIADAVYTVGQAAPLVCLHPVTLREKLRARVIKGSRRLGDWRILGADLLKAV